jgi:hypothetical protein
LTEDACLFGGDTLTLSDVAAVAGTADFGDVERVPRLSDNVRTAILDRARRMIEDGIDRMKTSGADVPVIVVGGGGFLLNEVPRGASILERPRYASVANAIGAAIGQVSGEVDRVLSYAGTTRATALAQVRAEVIRLAASAGAAPRSIKVVQIDEVALNYLPGDAVRVRARAVGDVEFT